ncbi:MAG: 30S ribosomal protein S16 [Deltaproteobacteria bacterium]|nr:30S ribosomal protein S16 [Deltaproteobacteria bacterium]
MAVTIRLARHGAKKKPFYRVVAADLRAPRDGRFLEVVGTYDPRNKVSGLNLKMDRIQHWISKGADVSETVRKVVKQYSRQGKATKEQAQG